MQAFILAAGFGTRLKFWTDRHPKALVPVGGIPMLHRTIDTLSAFGFNKIAVNVHHFSDQIVEYLSNRNFNADIRISDETDRILDTGGALLKLAEDKIWGNEPLLIHNVDILSDADLKDIMATHEKSCSDISLVTSDRNSSRKLVFGKDSRLIGWHDLKNNLYKPTDLKVQEIQCQEVAFSGIYVISPSVKRWLKIYSEEISNEVFPIMDFLLWGMDKINIGEIKLDKLNLIDIGKPDSYQKANELLASGTQV